MANADYRYLTPDEAGKILGVGRGQISVWIRAGLIKATNVGNGNIRPRWQISEEDLMGFHRPKRRYAKRMKVSVEEHVVKEPVVDPTEMTIRELLEENGQLRKELDREKAKNKKIMEEILAVLANNE